MVGNIFKYTFFSSKVNYLESFHRFWSNSNPIYSLFYWILTHIVYSCAALHLFLQVQSYEKVSHRGWGFWFESGPNSSHATACSSMLDLFPYLEKTQTGDLSFSDCSSVLLILIAASFSPSHVVSINHTSQNFTSIYHSTPESPQRKPVSRRLKPAVTFKIFKSSNETCLEA